MVIIGVIDFIEGLIAVIRKQYYVMTPNQVIVFDVKTWGWITLIWGIVLVLAGLALLSGSSVARWFTIVVASFNFIIQLGFLGGSQFILWTLTTLFLTTIVLYALIVHWDAAADLKPDPQM
jgi:hypothetical protein